MRILVTGGAGFIGKSLCRRLLEEGHEVLSLDIVESPIKHRNFKSLIGDITNPKYIDSDYGGLELWKDVDFCFHLAAMANVDEVREHRDKAFKVNLYGTFNIIEACRKLDVPLAYISTACFTKDTIVRCGNLPKKISNVKIGDRVLTHKGHYREVIDVGKRHYIGDLISIKTLGILPIDVTPEHPFLVCRHHKPDFGEPHIPDDINWVQAKNLQIGDTLIFPRTWRFNRGIGMKITQAERNRAWLEGLFIADGWLNDNDSHHKSVAYALGKDKLMLEKIKQIKLFSKACRIRTMIDGQYKAIYYGKNIVEKFREFYIDTSHSVRTKIIPNRIFTSSRRYKNMFLRGLFDGDGCKYQSKKGKLYTISTVSERLAYQIQFLLAEIGVFASISKRNTLPSIINGRVIKGTEIFRLDIRGKQAVRLATVFGEKFIEINKSYQKYRICQKYFALPIQKLSIRKYDGFVYNLEVEEDNSYTVGGLAAHNCVYGHTKQRLSTEDGPTFPVDWYGVTKRAGEELVKGLLDRYVILRFGTTLGAEMRPALCTHIFLKAAINKEAFPIRGTGNQTRNWIYIDDLVDGCVKAMEYCTSGCSCCEKETFNLVGQPSYSVRDLAHMCQQIVNKRVAITIDRLPARPDDVLREDISIEKAQTLLGWTPKVKLQEALKRIYKEWKKK